MASSFLILLTPFLLLIIINTNPPQVQAQSVITNLTGILDKAGQYTTFIRLLTSTQISNQISTQLQYSDQGTTVFAPTDNAFYNLKPGTLNDLSIQHQVEFVLAHVLPKYYSLVMFESISNPVRTEATGEDGGAFSLFFTTTTYNQVNVSTRVVETQVNNALRQEFPLAIYQVDKVLLPFDLFGTKTAPAPAPAASSSPLSPRALTKPAKGKTKKSPSPLSSSSSSAESEKSTSGSAEVGLGLVGWIGMILALCVVW